MYNIMSGFGVFWDVCLKKDGGEDRWEGGRIETIFEGKKVV